MSMRMNPYLVMNGNAREAVAFYQKALDATLVGLQTFGDMPSDPNHPTPDAMKDLVMHAMLKVGETDLMFSDTMPNMPHQPGNQVQVTLVTDSAATSQRIFAALSEGGQVIMPVQETFWSPAYGQLTDKFGVPWQINTEAK